MDALTGLIQKLFGGHLKWTQELTLKADWKILARGVCVEKPMLATAYIGIGNTVEGNCMAHIYLNVFNDSAFPIISNAMYFAIKYRANSLYLVVE